MMHRLAAMLTGLSLGLAVASPAMAADAVESYIIGYSQDVRYFAFEQFGIQDGSGFSYSDIFVLDLSDNSWVKGSPIRVLSGDESITLGESRRKSAARAAALLARLGISEPVTILASLPAFQAVAERTVVSYDRWYQLRGAQSRPAADLVLDRFQLRVETVTLDARPEHCTSDYGDVVGVALTLANLKSGETREVYRDQSIPTSRGCPSFYDVDKVVVPAGFPTRDRPVAIIGVYSPGFEGEDRRYVAIPLAAE